MAGRRKPPQLAQPSACFTAPAIRKAAILSGGKSVVDHWCGPPSGLGDFGVVGGQRLHQVIQNVIDSLKAHREAHQSFR